MGYSVMSPKYVTKVVWYILVQAPKFLNPKSQWPKFKISNCFGHWKIEIWDLFVIWCLELGILCFVIWDLTNSFGLHLGFKAIAVLIKGKIHTAVFMAWFFKKNAFFLLSGIFSGANGPLVFFAVVDFRTTHLDCLLRAGLRHSINKGWLYLKYLW